MSATPNLVSWHFLKFQPFPAHVSWRFFFWFQDNSCLHTSQGSMDNCPFVNWLTMLEARAPWLHLGNRHFQVKNVLLYWIYPYSLSYWHILLIFELAKLTFWICPYWVNFGGSVHRSFFSTKWGWLDMCRYYLGHNIILLNGMYQHLRLAGFTNCLLSSMSVSVLTKSIYMLFR